MVDPFSSPMIIAGGGGGIRYNAMQNGNPGVVEQNGSTSSGSMSTGGGVVNDSANVGYGGQVSVST